jgi:hypothetical protein
MVMGLNDKNYTLYHFAEREEILLKLHIDTWNDSRTNLAVQVDLADEDKSEIRE